MPSFKFFLAGLTQLLIATTLILPISTGLSGSVSAEETFYWTYSYGRGAGYTSFLSCHKGKRNGDLCYPQCRDGYKEVGSNICAKPGHTYGRGAGVLKESHKEHAGSKGHRHIVYRSRCPGSHPEQCGELCFKACRSGYKHSTCEICEKKGHSYGRGAGSVMEPTCRRGDVLGAPPFGTTCYKPCRRGTKGIGPVCWGEKPRGWMKCGAGIAKGYTMELPGQKPIRVSPHAVCGMVIGAQTMAVANLIAATCELAGNPGCGAYEKAEQIKTAMGFKKSEEVVQKVGMEIAKDLEPLAKEAGKMATAKAAPSAIASLISKSAAVFKAYKTLSAFKKATLAFNTVATTPAMHSLVSTAIYDPKSYEGRLRIARDAATIAQLALTFTTVVAPNPVLDELNAMLGVVAAFAYPVQGAP